MKILYRIAVFLTRGRRGEYLDVLETLICRSHLFPYTNVHYYLFAKAGFTKGCMEKAAEMGNVTLVGLADMIIGR